MYGRRRAIAGALLIGFLVLAGCKEETPSDLGAVLRSAPDSLLSVDLFATVIDTVFPIPVSLGNSPTAQIGQHGPYTTHVLYAMKFPTFTVDDGDTFRLDTASFSVELATTLGDAPFTGVLNVGLGEVQADQRDWSPDSVIVRLPDLTPAMVARDTTIDAVTFDDDTKLFFDLNLSNLADFDSVRAAGDSLEFNVALVFRSFASGEPGFLEYPYLNGVVPAAIFNGFSDDVPSGTILTANPSKRVTVVEFDSTYSTGTNWATSDGYRLHTWVLFDSVSTVLPPGAFVHRADFVITQVDSASGLIFGAGPSVGVMIPSDTTQVFSEAQNTLGLSFTATLENLPGSQVSLNITAYMLDQQEGTVPNTGMILRLSNEGTKARHYEYFGSQTADVARRPVVRIIYGVPSDFGEAP